MFLLAEAGSSWLLRSAGVSGRQQGYLCTSPPWHHCATLLLCLALFYLFFNQKGSVFENPYSSLHLGVGDWTLKWLCRRHSTLFVIQQHWTALVRMGALSWHVLCKYLSPWRAFHLIRQRMGKTGLKFLRISLTSVKVGQRKECSQHLGSLPGL